MKSVLFSAGAVLLAAGNPDLPNPASGGGQPIVSPLTVMTQPMPNTAGEEYRYFHCSMATASFHRADGKKLPFVQHFLKTNIAEDIAYFDEEIRQGNQYVRKATASEESHARLLEDPMGTVRESVKNELTVEELEKLLAARRAVAAAGGDDPVKRAEADRKKLEDTERRAAVIGAVKAADVTVHGHAAHTGANLANLAHMVKSK